MRGTLLSARRLGRVGRADLWLLKVILEFKEPTPPSLTMAGGRNCASTHGSCTCQ